MKKDSGMLKLLIFDTSNEDDREDFRYHVDPVKPYLALTDVSDYLSRSVKYPECEAYSDMKSSIAEYNDMCKGIAEKQHDVELSERDHLIMALTFELIQSKFFRIMEDNSVSLDLI